MTQVLSIDEKKYEPSTKIAGSFGYTGDYVSKLARDGKVVGKKVGRQWYVDPDSLKEFLQKAEANKISRGEKIRQERLLERSVVEQKVSLQNLPSHTDTFANALGVFALLATLIFSSYVFVANSISAKDVSVAVVEVSEDFAEVLNVQKHSQPALLGWLKGLFVTAEEDIFVEGEVGITNTQTATEGVVILDKEATEEEINVVREQFSDPVLVEQVDEDTGMITPVFKDGHGEGYRYLIVPVNPSNN